MMKVKIEVKRYEDAPWAPLLPGAAWAWRVTGANGNEVCAATRENKRHAQAEARRCAARLAKLQVDGVCGRGIQINHKVAIEA